MGTGLPFTRFLFPQAECVLCLAYTGDEVLCRGCTQQLASFAGEQVWSNQALDKRCSRGNLAILAFWPYAWPLSAVQQRCKFGGWRLGGRMLAHLAAQLCAASPELDLTDCVVVPAPMHWTRRVRRGGNHASLQGDALARALSLPCAPHWLKRTQARPQQMGLPRRQRLKNLKGSFVASNAVQGRRVLLFDDIVTTGSTMRYMAEALYAQRAEQVIGISLMRVD